MALGFSTLGGSDEGVRWSQVIGRTVKVESTAAGVAVQHLRRRCFELYGADLNMRVISRLMI